MPAADDLAHELLDEIGELYAIVLRISRRMPDIEPLTATQRLALIEIAVVGPLRLSDLASRMDTTAATASRAVDTLEEHRLVKRTADRDDGRAVQIAATPKGTRWAERRRAELLTEITNLPPHLYDAKFVQDIARLNDALRSATGHDEVARGALLSP
jgi:DNA-binding MarR family transcriptional regulator